MIFIKGKQKGFALVELLVAIGVLTLIIGAFGAFKANVFSLNRVLQVGLKNQEEAKKVVRPMANEVRSATQSNLGAYAIAESNPTSFSFYTDIDNDGLREKIRYFLDGTDFKKGIIKPSGNPLTYDQEGEQIIEVIHSVLPLDIFYYYNSSYDGTSDPLEDPVSPSDVRLIKVVLEIDDDPDNPPASFQVTTQVSMRNLKDNL
jgi:prepilin-type N-terminal cleavage/methylation domain-containing protein